VRGGKNRGRRAVAEGLLAKVQKGEKSRKRYWEGKSRSGEMPYLQGAEGGSGGREGTSVGEEFTYKGKVGMRKGGKPLWEDPGS